MSFCREGCLSPISPESWPLVQSFICHNRVLILDGHVQLKTSLQTQERHLFLFTDLLVVAKSKSHSHFKLKCQARLCEMWTAFCTEEVCEGSTDPDRSFVLGWPTTNCVANFSRNLLILKPIPSTGSEKDYKLWVISGREHAPYPLIGHEYPFGITMSHIRDAMPHGSKPCACPRQLQGPFLPEQLPQELQCQFVLKPSQVAVCQQLNDLSQKSFKRKRSIINWAFWRGPGTHLDNAPLSSTSAVPGKLFGLLLTTICEDDNLPKPLLDMLSLLYQEGPSTKGIFRRSGSAKTFKELKEKLDSGTEVDLARESIFVTASLFKDFLRNIPGSILSSQLCDKWVSVLDQGNNEEKIKSIQRLLEHLPRANVVLLRYIFGVLHGIEVRSEENQMNAFNLAVCIAPSLLWPPVSSTPDIESEFIKKISSLVQFLIENCCRIFGDEVTSLFGEILMTCKRENSSDVASLHQNDSSYDSLENEANDEADSSSSDWIKTCDQDYRSRESVFTLSDGDSEQTEVDEIQSQTKLKQLEISDNAHPKFSLQENSSKSPYSSGVTSAAASGAPKAVRRHRRSSEPAVGLQGCGSGRAEDAGPREKATRKASCDVVLPHQDEECLCQRRSLQVERQKLSNQSLLVGIGVGRSDNTNKNVERKDLSHCLLPPTPEGLNTCSGFSSFSQSSSGTSPSVSSLCSLDSAFSQFSDQALFTFSETSSPFDGTFQLLKKHEDTAAAAVADDCFLPPTTVPPSPQPTDTGAERGLVGPSRRSAPLKPTDGVDGCCIKPDLQPLPLKVTGRDGLHEQRGGLEKHYSNPKFEETDQSFLQRNFNA
uniref:Rho GTPase-activating protein 20 n=1 Tax=Geospiza parvula TaxID=87175 RepID=A0A8C3Q8T2_GEOPR